MSLAEIVAVAKQKDPAVSKVVILSIDDVESRRDIDMRRLPNPAYPEIKESIRVNGVENHIVVTRKPGQNKYFVKKGGNTRLRALRELWEETNDPKYYTVEFIFEPWIDDSDEFFARIASGSENINRGDLAFIEQAEFFVTLRNEIQSQEGKPLNLRDCCHKIRQYGFRKIDAGTLSRYSSAVRLYPFMVSAFDEQRIGKTYFERVLRLEKILLEYVTKNVAVEKHIEFYEGWHRCLQDADERGNLDVESLQNDMEDWIAQWLGVSYLEVVTDIKTITFGIPPSLSYQEEEFPDNTEVNTTLHPMPMPSTSNVSPNRAEEGGQPLSTTTSASETKPLLAPCSGTGRHSPSKETFTDIKKSAPESAITTIQNQLSQVENAKANNAVDTTADNVDDDDQEEDTDDWPLQTKISPSYPVETETSDIFAIRKSMVGILTQLLNHFPALQTAIYYDERGPYILPPTNKLSLDADELYIWWHLFSAVNSVLEDPFVCIPHDAIVTVFGDHEEFSNFIFRCPYVIGRFEPDVLMGLDEITRLMREASRLELIAEFGHMEQ